jgi:hypothetical protein
MRHGSPFASIYRGKFRTWMKNAYRSEVPVHWDYGRQL